MVLKFFLKFIFKIMQEENNEDIDKLLNDLKNDLPINKNSEKNEINNKEFNTNHIKNNSIEKHLNHNIKDSKAEKISYLLQNHICEETVITKCSIPADFKFKNAIKN